MPSCRSVLNNHIGQMGVQTGWEVWRLLCHEHGIDLNGCPTYDVSLEENKAFQAFFTESASGNYVPKAVLMDSEPGVLDALRSSSMGNLFKDQFMINGKQDCRSLMGLAWYPTFCGTGHHAENDNALRKLHEICDNVSGTMLYFSTCGGTGSGFGCRSLQTIRDINPKSVCHGIVGMPSPTISGSPMECMNTVTYLGLSRFDNLYMNINVIYDNEALYRQANHLYGKYITPTYQHVNQLIAASVSTSTASLRFDGQLNVDLNEFQTNLVPFPSMNSLYHCQAPLNANQKTDRMSVTDITFEAFEPGAHMCSVNSFGFANKWTDAEADDIWSSPPYLDDEKDNMQALQKRGAIIPKDNYIVYHKFIGCSLMYRGDVMPARINRAMRSFVEQKQPQFVSWVQTGFKIGVNSPPLRFPKDWSLTDMPRAIGCLINNTVIVEKLKNVVWFYKKQAEMGAYQQWTSVGGIEQSIVDSASLGICELIEKYESCMKNMQDGEDVRDILTQAPQPIGKF